MADKVKKPELTKQELGILYQALMSSQVQVKAAPIVIELAKKLEEMIK